MSGTPHNNYVASQILKEKHQIEPCSVRSEPIMLHGCTYQGSNGGVIIPFLPLGGGGGSYMTWESDV